MSGNLLKQIKASTNLKLYSIPGHTLSYVNTSTAHMKTCSRLGFEAPELLLSLNTCWIDLDIFSVTFNIKKT